MLKSDEKAEFFFHVSMVIVQYYKVAGTTFQSFAGYHCRSCCSTRNSLYIWCLCDLNAIINYFY